MGQFELIPCDSAYDFEDKSRFTKLSPSEAQKMHLSAAYQHLPSMMAAGTLAQAYIARFPEGLPHTLTALRQGGYGSMIQGSHGFVGSASFFPVTGQALFLGAFTAMSVASGQYFLTQINSRLEVIHRGIGEILDFLYGDKKAELMSEISFTKYAYENYASIMAHDSQRTATIASLQSAKKVAMNDIEFYIHDLGSTVESSEKDLKKVLDKLAVLVEHHTAPDLMICNYVYEHVEDGTSHTVRYTNVFPQNRLFNWTHVGHFRSDQNILMHSVMYRTEVLRKCGMVLPKHTFYVDNIFVYQPLPYVKSMYYMDLDLYRYFIGRADQSVNESIMVKRVDQQLRVTRHMIDCQDLDELKDQKRLHAYMVHYLSVMMAVSDIFLLLDGSDEAKAKRTGLWQYLKGHVSTGVYRAVRYNLGGLTDLKFPGGDKLTLGVYRQLRKVFKFN